MDWLSDKLMRDAEQVIAARLPDEDLAAIDPSRASILASHMSPFSEKGRSGELWAAFSGKFHELVCTKSVQFRDVRKHLNGYSKTIETMTISSLAITLAPAFGLEASALVPFLALALLIVSRVGLAAWCESHRKGGR